MKPFVAISTTKGQAESCNNRDLFDVAKIARSAAMDVVDGKWIKARLSSERGAAARLAEAVGIRPDQMSRILKGERRVQPEEIPAILRYFEPMRDTTAPGFAEDAAVPFKPARAAAVRTLINTLAPTVRRAEAFRVTRAAPGFGLYAGDILIVDLSAGSQHGDLVLATTTDPITGEGQTGIFRRVDQWLTMDSPDQRPLPLQDDDGTIAILATIKASLRSKALT